MKKSATIAASTMLFVFLGVAYGASASDAKTQYPSMAPLALYMTDRDTEIAMAECGTRSDHTRRDGHGSHRARLRERRGRQEWLCLCRGAGVDVAGKDSADFWNPKMRGPICFNPPAVRSILPATFERTKLALAGKSKSEIIADNKRAYDEKQLPPLEGGSMSYMMSKKAYLTAEGGNLAHIMVYSPHADPATWGICACQPTRHVESAVQRRRADRCVGNFGRQVVRRNTGAGDVANVGGGWVRSSEANAAAGKIKMYLQGCTEDL